MDFYLKLALSQNRTANLFSAKITKKKSRQFEQKYTMRVLLYMRLTMHCYNRSKKHYTCSKYRFLSNFDKIEHDMCIISR